MSLLHFRRRKRPQTVLKQQRIPLPFFHFFLVTGDFQHMMYITAFAPPAIARSFDCRQYSPPPLPSPLGIRFPPAKQKSNSVLHSPSYVTCSSNLAHATRISAGSSAASRSPGFRLDDARSPPAFSRQAKPFWNSRRAPSRSPRVASSSPRADAIAALGRELLGGSACA